MCSRRPNSPYLVGALLPVLTAIKKMDRAVGVGKNSAGGEASALNNRLQVMFWCDVAVAVVVIVRAQQRFPGDVLVCCYGGKQQAL